MHSSKLRLIKRFFKPLFNSDDARQIRLSRLEFQGSSNSAARVFSCGYATQCSIEVNGVVSAAASPATSHGVVSAAASPAFLRRCFRSRLPCVSQALFPQPPALRFLGVVSAAAYPAFLRR